MTRPKTTGEWADKLEAIANRISESVYNYGSAMQKGYKPERYITYDDADYLKILAKQLRGEDGQLAHEFGRKNLPWRIYDECRVSEEDLERCATHEAYFDGPDSIECRWVLADRRIRGKAVGDGQDRPTEDVGPSADGLQ